MYEVLRAQAQPCARACEEETWLFLGTPSASTAFYRCHMCRLAGYLPNATPREQRTGREFMIIVYRNGSVHHEDSPVKGIEYCACPLLSKIALEPEATSRVIYKALRHSVSEATSRVIYKALRHSVSGTACNKAQHYHNC